MYSLAHVTHIHTTTQKHTQMHTETHVSMPQCTNSIFVIIIVAMTVFMSIDNYWFYCFIYVYCYLLLLYILTDLFKSCSPHVANK